MGPLLLLTKEKGCTPGPGKKEAQLGFKNRLLLQDVPALLPSLGTLLKVYDPTATSVALPSGVYLRVPGKKFGQ